MMKRKLLLGAMIASSLYVLPMPAAAETYIKVAPPAPRHEKAHSHRNGHVWVPGYWDWRGQRHVWVKGHYVRERPGYVYHAHRWQERDGRWVLERGRWNRGPAGDRDRDGIPNRLDRDKDNDGVRNRNDSHPNNPRRN